MQVIGPQDQLVLSSPVAIFQQPLQLSPVIAIWTLHTSAQQENCSKFDTLFLREMSAGGDDFIDISKYLC